MTGSFSQVGGPDGLLANFSQIFGRHAEEALGAQAMERLEACTNLFSVVEAAAAGASDAANDAFTTVLQAAQRAMESAEDLVEDVADGSAFDPIVARAHALRDSLQHELELATTDAAELLAPLMTMWDPEMLEQHGSNASVALRQNISAALLAYALADMRNASAIAANASTPILDLGGVLANLSSPIPMPIPQVNMPGLPLGVNATNIQTLVNELLSGALAAGGQQASQAQTIISKVQEDIASAHASALKHVPKAFDALEQMMAEPTTRGVDILQAFAKDIAAQPEPVLEALLAAAGLESKLQSAANLTMQIPALAEEWYANHSYANHSVDIAAVTDILRMAGLGQSGTILDKSMLNTTTLSGIVDGMGVNTSAATTAATKCYEAAAATMSEGLLAIEALPTWPEVLREFQRMGAAVAAVVLEQAGIPDGLVDAIAGHLKAVWPDFGSVWDAHVAQITHDLGQIVDAVEAAANATNITNATGFGRDALSGLVPSHPANLASRRLRRSARGRALLTTIIEAPSADGHKVAMRQWRAGLKRQMRHTATATRGIGKPQRKPMGATSLQSISAGIPAGPALMTVSTDWTWIAHSALVALLGLAGISAPATSVLEFNGTASTGAGVVSSVYLTAPLVGYGIARELVGSFTARNVPVETMQRGGTTFVVKDGSRDASALRSCDAFGYPHYNTVDEQPIDAMLFQPSAMVQFNWLLNAGERPDGSARNFCPQLEEPLHNRTIVDGDFVLEQPYGRFGLPSLIFDPEGDQAAAQGAPSGGSTRARIARQQIERSCPNDPLSLMRTEIAPLCRESYIATGQKAPFTDASLGNHGDRSPQLILRDKLGNPVAGKTCKITIADHGSGLFDGWFDFTPLRLVYECGPSDADGVITIRDLRIIGGSSRTIHFLVTVDDVEAVPDPSSQWRFDTQLFYLSTEHSKGDHLHSIFYGGSGSIHLFVLLSLFVMSHNALSLRYNARVRAPLPLRLLGLMSLLALCYTTATFFSRHFTNAVGAGEEGRISLISMRDMVSTRAAALSPGSWILAALSLFLSVWIALQIARLWISDQLKSLLSACRRAVHVCGLERKLAPMRKVYLWMHKGHASCTDRVQGFLSGPCGSVRACVCNLPGAGRVKGMFKAFTKVSDDVGGELEPPPYIHVLGFRFVDPFEPRAERRQRCARNYVSSNPHLYC